MTPKTDKKKAYESVNLHCQFTFKLKDRIKQGDLFFELMPIIKKYKGTIDFCGNIYIKHAKTN